MGLLHIIDSNGLVEFRVNGKLHRLDGPAINNDNWYYEWWVNGERHREDGGPAIECKNGYKEWWVHGKNITDEVNYWMRINNISYPFCEYELALFNREFITLCNNLLIILRILFFHYGSVIILI